MTTIHFDYNEEARKWEVSATAASSDEAKQAFAAVILTILDIPPTKEYSFRDTIAEFGNEPFSFRIIPALINK